MKNRYFLFLLLFAVVSTSFTGCKDEAETSDEHVIVMPGKADDFLSVSAQEYILSATSTVTLESSYADSSAEERLERAKQLIQYKHVVVGWFLNVYLVEKSHDASNEEYGGFKSLVKNGAFEDLEITEVDTLTYSFKFQQLIGGTNDLMTLLPTEMQSDGKRHFELIMGNISNSDMARLETNSEWYRSSPWSSFNPSSLTEDKLERLDMAIWPEVRSVDAWIDYNRLFADGLVTMGVHFGWDYHNNYHEVHSESIYTWLIDTMDFTSPVATWAEYNRSSGPLTKTIKANGRNVDIEISIYYGKTGTETDPDTDAGGVVLEEDMRFSLSDREVIVYSGHSGPLYGFALGNWRKTDEGDLDDSELPTIDMPANVYQVVLAEGCDTYGLGQSFFENPAKTGHKNLDIITTTNSSNASTPTTVQDFIRAIAGTNYNGDHTPVLYSALMKDMDSNSYWYNTMYGIHGIDDNPNLHPYANVEKLCEPCSKDSDCGEMGMECSVLGTEGKICTATCTGDAGCPEGYSCEKSATGYYVSSKQCVPLGFNCSNPDPEPSQVLIINEIHADPAADLTGDANGDGVRHFGDDEFVELVNISSGDIDLSSWIVSDGYMVRFTFPQGTILGAGQSVVIFGGGDISSFSTMAFTTDGGLGLNNSGDTITVSDSAGKTVDTIAYGSEGGNDRSITRATDGDADSSFIPHPDSLFSPGTKSDGSSF
jgi:Lamin Tail Domain